MLTKIINLIAYYKEAQMKKHETSHLKDFLYTIEPKSSTYAVVNKKTGETQSHWDNKKDASTACKDLNMAYNKGLIR